MRFLLVLFLFGMIPFRIQAADYSPEQRHYWQVVQPIFRKHCNAACHNADDNKGGLNLEGYDFIFRIQRDGELFGRVISMMEDGSMPPQGKPRMPEAEMDTALTYIRKYLKEALSKPTPGLIPPRRLSRRAYRYAVEDLTGITVNVEERFPKDASGGEGFDNFSRTLFISTLLMERYVETAEWVAEQAFCDQENWRKLVPEYHRPWWAPLGNAWNRLTGRPSYSEQHALSAAEGSLIPVLTRAYRRIPTQEELQQLLSFFQTVYQHTNNRHRFDIGMKEVLKAVLVSSSFLIRQEADPIVKDPYPVNDFDLASRLSFFLWSSLPDDTLLQAAYRQELRDTAQIRLQVARMLRNPKSKRMAESFASQWLDIDKMNDVSFSMDPEKFPGYSPDLKKAMMAETVEYCYYTLTQSRNLLELIDSKHTFLNETLAQHYCLPDIKGAEMRKVALTDATRGGILGMASVLTATSTPTRTSPVLRGKWVLEKILGTPVKAPPPNVPELEKAKAAHEELPLRELLTLHRADPACQGCHIEMDDLGFAMENFDAIGRWREDYGSPAVGIDATGHLKSGEFFNGPVELKRILQQKKELFAKNISKKMLGFALGRGIDFMDSETVNQLTRKLIESNFDALVLFQEIAVSYPFRYKISDPVVVETDV